MRDHEYMAQCGKKPRDYFLATGERDTDCYRYKENYQADPWWL